MDAEKHMKDVVDTGCFTGEPDAGVRWPMMRSNLFGPIPF